MLRECHRVVKPGGCIAGYVIHTPAGLSAADEQRASELGLDDVTAAAGPEDLMRAAGFSHVIREDVTRQFSCDSDQMLRTRCQPVLPSSRASTSAGVGLASRAPSPRHLRAATAFA